MPSQEANFIEEESLRKTNKQKIKGHLAMIYYHHTIKIIIEEGKEKKGKDRGGENVLEKKKEVRNLCL